MYFEWKKMPFDPALGSGHVPVVIVGGGPVGLAMALALSRQNVRCCVLESRDQVSDGSRAIVMTRRTMQIFDAIGVADDILAKAVHWTLNAVHFGTRPIYEMRLSEPPGEKHRTTNLQQCWVEQLLLDRLSDGGLAEVRWQSTVTGIDDSGAGAQVTVLRPDGSTYALSADYVIAADGARGSTRRMAGLSYEGERYQQSFVITDFIMRSEREIGRRVWFSPPYAPGTTVLQHSGAFDMWRLDYQLKPEDDPEEEISTRRVAERLAAHMEMIGETAPYEVVWTSIYRANALTLPTYGQRNVFFIGDAAHQIPIFGGRGINNGFMDVANLAWKLGQVIRGRAPKSLLDTYSAERRKFIVDTIADLSRVTIYMTSPSPAVALMRDAVLSLSLTQPFVHSLFDPFRVPKYTSLKIETTDSAAESDRGFKAGPVVGQVIPDMPVLDVTGSGRARLFDYLQGGFTCIAWGGADAADANVDRLFAELTRGEDRISCVAFDVDRELGHGVVLRGDTANAAFNAGPGTVYLVRPDHHVIGRWRSVRSADILASVRHALGRESVAEMAMAG